jgi:ferrochelatase
MKTAIVLFNLGGPDAPESVQKFRLNLFNDPAIIRAPIFIRFWLSRLIAASSAKAAEKNYALIGGKSPLLAITQSQASALQNRLREIACDIGAKCFVAMRYWHPFAAETVAAVAAFAPDQILLLPLYPHFSTATTGSSLTDWHEQAAKAGLAVPSTTICCYYEDAAYIKSLTDLLRIDIAQARAKMPPGAKLRLLFSAHGLPETIVKKGDPYQAQIEASSAAVIAELSDQNVEYKICYQSRATPQKWLAPSTIDAIAEAARDQVAVLLVPIAFVSDHIETLVELDIENAELAHRLGVPFYFRAAVPNADAAFIDALAALAKNALTPGPGLPGLGLPGGGLQNFKSARACDARHKNCPWKKIPDAA